MAFLDFLPLIGNIGSTLLGGLFGSISTSNTNETNVQLARENREWQTQENEIARQFNKELAAWQNNMNIAQWHRERRAALEDWHRENVYNSPAAQMQRFQAAGLNPNLIYGQSNTGGSLSSPSIAGSLTSGAPASAPTASPATVIPKNFDKMFESLGSALMHIPTYKEDVRGRRLENDLKESELARRGYENKALAREDEWQEYLRLLTIDPDDLQNMIDNPHQYNSILSTPRGRKLLFELNREYNQNKLGAFELDKAAFDKKLRDDTFDDLKREIKAKANISESEAEYAIKTLGYKLNKAVSDDDWYEFEKWLNVVDVGGDMISTILDNFGKLGLLKKGFDSVKQLLKKK